MVDEREPEMDDVGAPEERALLPLAMDGPLMVGTPIVAADGEVLGTVGDDAGDRFKVAAPMAEDYWLPKQMIAGMAPGGDLVVSFEKDTLDSAKVAGPGEA